ncbi:hypothetical protein NA56DRAFT_435055 [Hyaloscypha hepaticicola]|uniref:Uncharacterized protein n=1 Tax=Hyaloscypha hepaticicola TaxID=2082293 RepID=A0A2J6QGM3_9HELO|nr:hypothetical protein NA56DRAFT_435055 [Hyaloscypha hepaticicola]
MLCKLIKSDPKKWPDIVSVDKGKLRISFRRTIRVSDNDGTSLLPPDLGAFPLYSVSTLYSKLPQPMLAKGGILFPMHDQEAMWIKFESDLQYAIKVYVGGVNAVSGEPAVENMATRLRRQTLGAQGASLQDYVVTPNQRWIDGIAISPGVVRQFVATPSGNSNSVEAQITGEDAVAGIQFEITKRKRVDNKIVYIDSGSGPKIEILVDLEMATFRDLGKLVQKQRGVFGRKPYFFITQFDFWKQGMKIDDVDWLDVTLEDGNIHENDTIEMEWYDPNYHRRASVVWRDQGDQILEIDWPDENTVRYFRHRLSERTHHSPSRLRIWMSSKDSCFSDLTRTRWQCNLPNGLIYVQQILYGGWMPGYDIPANIKAEMALAAGGLIKQSIHNDPYEPDSWEPSSTITLNVQVLNASIFEAVTGKVPPRCPISERAYKAAGYPYFNIPEASSSVSGNFSGVKSLGQLSSSTNNSEETKSVKEQTDYSFWDHINYPLKLDTSAATPKFRTVSEIEEEVRNSRVVSRW